MSSFQTWCLHRCIFMCWKEDKTSWQWIIYLRCHQPLSYCKDMLTSIVRQNHMVSACFKCKWKYTLLHYVDFVQSTLFIYVVFPAIKQENGPTQDHIDGSREGCTGVFKGSFSMSAKCVVMAGYLGRHVHDFFLSQKNTLFNWTK